MPIYVTVIIWSYYGYPTVLVLYYMVSGSCPARVRRVNDVERRVNDPGLVVCSCVYSRARGRYRIGCKGHLFAI